MLLSGKCCRWKRWYSKFWILNSAEFRHATKMMAELKKGKKLHLKKSRATWPRLPKKLEGHGSPSSQVASPISCRYKGSGLLHLKPISLPSYHPQRANYPESPEVSKYLQRLLTHFLGPPLCMGCNKRLLCIKTFVLLILPCATAVQDLSSLAHVDNIPLYQPLSGKGTIDFCS